MRDNLSTRLAKAMLLLVAVGILGAVVWKAYLVVAEVSAMQELHKDD